MATLTKELVQAMKAAPKGAKQDVLRDNGWTEEEIKNLPFVPRTQEMGDGSPASWPKIDGQSTYPFTWMLTEQEKQTYYAWKKGTTGTGTPRMKTVTVTKSPEVLAAEAKLREKLEALGDAECLEAFNLLHPTQEMLERKAKLAQLEELKRKQEELAKELGL